MIQKSDTKKYHFNPVKEQLDKMSYNELVLHADEARKLAIPNKRKELLLSNSVRISKIYLNDIDSKIRTECNHEKHFIEYIDFATIRHFDVVPTPSEFEDAVRLILDTISDTLKGLGYEIKKTSMTPIMSLDDRLYKFTRFNIYILISWV